MEPLIRMEGIKKVFYTDEVETHALSDVHLEIHPGEDIAMQSARASAILFWHSASSSGRNKKNFGPNPCKMQRSCV